MSTNPDIIVRRVDASYIHVTANGAIIKELSDLLSFVVPEANYKRRGKMKRWDGVIRLFDKRTHTTTTGLLYFIKRYAKENNFVIAIEPCLRERDTITDEQVNDFVKYLGLPSYLTPHAHQIDGFKRAAERFRQLLISPTSSGKSLIIYMLVRWFAQHKILIIVPTIMLVEQLFKDFLEYGMEDDGSFSLIHSGEGKDTENKRVAISTYQSVHTIKNQEWFDQWDMVIGDEAHLYDAKSIKAIMQRLKNAHVRTGTTGSLKDIEHSRLTLEGLFGPAYVVATTMELVEKGLVSEFNIVVVVLRYPPDDRKVRRGYFVEKDFLNSHPLRNKYLDKLLNSLDGNTIFMSDRVVGHVEPAYDRLKSRTNRETFMVTGKVDVDVRENIRALVEKTESADIICNPQVFSTGVNIKRIKNLVMPASGKSKIRLIQSIGRTLRLTEHYDVAYIFDIADDLRITPHEPNATLKHLADRVKVYAAEGFKYKIVYVDL